MQELIKIAASYEDNQQQRNPFVTSWNGAVFLHRWDDGESTASRKTLCRGDSSEIMDMHPVRLALGSVGSPRTTPEEESQSEEAWEQSFPGTDLIYFQVIVAK